MKQETRRKLIELARRTTASDISIVSKRNAVIVVLPTVADARGYAKVVKRWCNPRRIDRYVALR